jgi:uncharacterized membrane protein
MNGVRTIGIKNGGKMKTLCALLAVLAVALVFSGAVRPVAAQTSLQRTEEPQRYEEDLRKKIRDRVPLSSEERELALQQELRRRHEIDQKIARLLHGSLSSPTDRKPADYEKDFAELRRRGIDFARDKALEDIAAHVPMLLFLFKDSGESVSSWMVGVAKKLPSQPVAVIQLLTNIHDAYPESRHIDNMSAMHVFKDALSFQDYKNLMVRSVMVLESFDMKDEKSEKVRKQYIQKINDALATGKPW